MSKSIVTISREFGSGGKQLAKMVAEKLQVSFYDRELIRLVAEKSGISLDIVEETGEYKPKGWAFGVASPNIYIGNMIDMLPTADKIYIVQSEIIKDIASKGSCVIVGRSANYILRDRIDCLNVFVHAPVKERLARIVERGDVDEKSALKLMEKKDRERAQHSRHYTDLIWNDPSNYHMCLNSGMGLEKCRDLIVEALK